MPLHEQLTCHVCWLLVTIAKLRALPAFNFRDVFVAISCFWHMHSSTSPPAHAPGHSCPHYNVLGLYTGLASILAIWLKMSEISSDSDVGCRDNTVPKTVETRRHCEEDREHATFFCNQWKQSFLGIVLWKIVAWSQSSLQCLPQFLIQCHPYIFIDFYTCICINTEDLQS